MDGAVACCEADGAVGGSGAHQQNFAHGLQKVQRREVSLRREVASAGLCRVDKDDFLLMGRGSKPSSQQYVLLIIILRCTH